MQCRSVLRLLLIMDEKIILRYYISVNDLYFN